LIDLGCYYDPHAEGSTEREWVEAVADFIAEVTAQELGAPVPDATPGKVWREWEVELFDDAADALLRMNDDDWFVSPHGARRIVLHVRTVGGERANLHESIDVTRAIVKRLDSMQRIKTLQGKPLNAWLFMGE
jgi:hypothetical protein